MKDLVHNDDLEVAHGDADDLLIETIRLLAKRTKHAPIAGKIIAAYGNVGKWYA